MDAGKLRFAEREGFLRAYWRGDAFPTFVGPPIT